MDRKDIISYARQLREVFGTRDPFVIAEGYGYNITFSQHAPGTLMGTTYRYDNDHPVTIIINDMISKAGKTVICAHELGHALFHSDYINHYDGIFSNKNLQKNIQSEMEANLFAVALLFDDEDFNYPIESMSGYILKRVLDHNISFNK